MANPFQDKQNTTGGKAGFGAFEELQVDQASTCGIQANRHTQTTARKTI
jgi:hypothetical protein